MAKTNYESVRDWRERNSVKWKAQSKRYYEKNKAIISKKNSQRNYENKIICLAFYSNNECICNCCGEFRIEFLTIDHIYNDGAKHRKEMKSSIFHWLIKNDFPQGFQVLCMNCNFSKGIHGYCPHEEEK